MPTITIIQHEFIVETRDGQIMVSFETNAKDVIEIQYERQEFLRYFTKEHATSLENYLQQRFPEFQ